MSEVRKAEGLVLAHYPFRERDLILRIFTREYGLISGIAKSARGTKSRFKGHLEVLSEVDIVFYYKEKTELYNINNAQCRKWYRKIRDDLVKLANALYVLDMLRLTMAQEDPHESVYDAALDLLEIIEKQDDYQTNLRKFEFFLMQVCGIEPLVETCAVCQGSHHAFLEAFSPLHNGLVCGHCRDEDEQAVWLSPNAIRFIRDYFVNKTPSTLLLKPGEHRQLRLAVARFLELNFGSSLKSLKFLMQVE